MLGRLLRPLCLLVGLCLVLGACGGGATAAEGPGEGNAIGIRPTAAPTSGPIDDTLPAELSFADKPVVIEGATTLKAAAGEVLELDYIVLNPTGSTERFAFRASASTPTSTPTASSQNIRIDSRDVAALTVSYAVPLQVEVGDVIDLEVLAANTAEVSRRDTIYTEIEIIDATGKRPQAGNDRAETTTNQRVTAYVIGNDIDSDGNIDYTSARMITGGFRAVSASVDSNGTVSYEPYANVTGKDKLLYEICDSEGRCDTSVVTITIRSTEAG